MTLYIYIQSTGKNVIHWPMSVCVLLVVIKVFILFYINKVLLINTYMYNLMLINCLCNIYSNHLELIFLNKMYTSNKIWMPNWSSITHVISYTRNIEKKHQLGELCSARDWNICIIWPYLLLKEYIKISYYCLNRLSNTNVQNVHVFLLHGFKLTPNLQQLMIV